MPIKRAKSRNAPRKLFRTIDRINDHARPPELAGPVGLSPPVSSPTTSNSNPLAATLPFAIFSTAPSACVTAVPSRLRSTRFPFRENYPAPSRPPRPRSTPAAAHTSPDSSFSLHNPPYPCSTYRPHCHLREFAPPQSQPTQNGSWVPHGCNKAFKGSAVQTQPALHKIDPTLTAKIFVRRI